MYKNKHDYVFSVHKNTLWLKKTNTTKLILKRIYFEIGELAVACSTGTCSTILIYKGKELRTL